MDQQSAPGGDPQSGGGKRKRKGGTSKAARAKAGGKRKRQGAEVAQEQHALEKQPAKGKGKPRAKVMRQLAKRSGVKRAEVRKVLAALATLIREATESGGRLVIPGIARFRVGPNNKPRLRLVPALRQAS